VPAACAPVLDEVATTQDPRLDRLKQWVVNLDYRVSKGEPVKPILDDFFAKVAILLEGVPMEFDKVDERTRQVLVRTQDGSIPIEQISQGMASLVSWVCPG
jgi:hypothetical protein